jgi:hypothetical protein
VYKLYLAGFGILGYDQLYYHHQELELTNGTFTLSEVGIPMNEYNNAPSGLVESESLSMRKVADDPLTSFSPDHCVRSG